MRIILVVLAVVVSSVAARAASFVIPPDEDMVQRSHLIVIASALDSETGLSPDGEIETITRMRIDEVLMQPGLPPVGGFIRVVSPGGVLRERARHVPGAPRFARGAEMLLFLRQVDTELWAVTDLTLGKFVFLQDWQGRRIVLRDSHELHGPVHPGGATETARDAAAFVEFIRERARNRAGNPNYRLPGPRSIDSQSYAPGTIVDTGSVSSNAVNSSSPSAYTMDMGDGKGARWNVFPSPVTFVSPNTLPNAASGGSSAINEAMQLWNAECESNITYRYGGVSSAAQAGVLGPADRIHSIRWEADLSRIGVTPYSCSSGGVLGYGGVTQAVSPHTYRGELLWTINEADVDMNRGLANCGSSSAFESLLRVALAHELGHTLGFRHSDQGRVSNPPSACGDPLPCSSTAIMRASVPRGATALQEWDIAAARNVYAAQSTCTGTTAGVRGDLNLDGRADIVWRRASTGDNAVWFLQGFSVSGAYLPVVTDPNMHVVGIGDVNADGSADIVWRNSATGENAIWLMRGSTVLQGIQLPAIDLAMSVAAVADVDGNGSADIIWRNRSTGINAVWMMSGGAIAAGHYLPHVDPAMELAASGDLNVDGRADLVWRNQSNGQNAAWLMSGNTIIGSGYLPTVTGSGWSIAGAVDADANGSADLFWRNHTTGEAAIWLMNGLSPTGRTLPTVTPPWRMDALGDFNGDGYGDVFWRNPLTGENAIWFMQGTSVISSGFVTSLEPEWRPSGPR